MKSQAFTVKFRAYAFRASNIPVSENKHNHHTDLTGAERVYMGVWGYIGICGMMEDELERTWKMIWKLVVQ